jgi:hypothetical protein
MNMPGFTAGISLYKGSKFYRLNVAYFNVSQDVTSKRFAIVQPQVRKIDYECVHDCLEATGPTNICNINCTE